MRLIALLFLIFILSAIVVINFYEDRCSIETWSFKNTNEPQTFVYHPHHEGCHKCNSLVLYRFIFEKDKNQLLYVKKYLDFEKKDHIIFERLFMNNKDDSKIFRYDVVILEN